MEWSLINSIKTILNPRRDHYAICMSAIPGTKLFLGLTNIWFKRYFQEKKIDFSAHKCIKGVKPERTRPCYLAPNANLSLLKQLFSPLPTHNPVVKKATRPEAS